MIPYIAFDHTGKRGKTNFLILSSLIITERDNKSSERRLASLVVMMKITLVKSILDDLFVYNFLTLMLVLSIHGIISSTPAPQ